MKKLRALRPWLALVLALTAVPGKPRPKRRGRRTGPYRKKSRLRRRKRIIPRAWSRAAPCSRKTE